MASQFPQSIDQFTTKVDGTIHYASHQNELQDAVGSIQQYLIGNPIVNPEDTQIPIPSWEYPALTAALSPSGVKSILVNWLPVNDINCIGYVVQRAVTETSVQSTPQYGWTNITTITNSATTQYTDTSGISAGSRYWYKIAGLKANIKTGNFNNPLYVDFTAASVYGDPDAPISIEPYIDGTGHLCATWTLQPFDSGDNYYTYITFVISGSSNPTNDENSLYHTAKKSWNDSSINLNSLWRSTEPTLEVDAELYIHGKTANIWGLESTTWTTYGPFTIMALVGEYTQYIGNAWENFETLVENKFYYNGTDEYIFNPQDFASDIPNLKFLGTDIAANTIQTQALAVGSGQRNFEIRDVYFHTNDSGSNHNINGYLRVTVGELPTLIVINDPNEEDTAKCVWKVSKFEDVTFASNSTPNDIAKAVSTGTYYVYFKCNKTDQDDCEIKLINADPDLGLFKAPSDSTHYWYLAGMYVVPVTGFSKIALSHGFTFIDGNHITTGEIDCNYITVHGGSNRGVVIDSNGLNITNGQFSITSGADDNIVIDNSGILISKESSSVTVNSNGLFATSATGSSFKLSFDDGLEFKTAGGGVTLDETGLDCTANGTTFSLNTTAGLTMTTSNGKTHIDSTGIWTGSTTSECLMGLISTGVYGFLAGSSYSSGKRAILTNDGIKCYDSAGNLVINTGGTNNQIINSKSSNRVIIGHTTTTGTGTWNSSFTTTLSGVTAATQCGSKFYTNRKLHVAVFDVRASVGIQGFFAYPVDGNGAIDYTAISDYNSGNGVQFTVNVGFSKSSSDPSGETIVGLIYILECWNELT